MQLCAILSQIHKHKDALKQAYKSVRLIHHLFKDLNDLCIYYAQRIELEKKSKDKEIVEFDVGEANEMYEDGLTIHEKLAVKLLPIVEEVIKKMVKEEIPYNYNEEVKLSEKADMRNILGFLNQNEWVYNLNIGNIMQIPSVSHTELMHTPRIEYELSREAFLEKITILSVAYFCTSTELRFIIQLRDEEEDKKEVKHSNFNNLKVSTDDECNANSKLKKLNSNNDPEVESEYWHAKSLEIACIFLPSECPLLNHILLSYEKHHAPTQYSIPEESEYTDNLTIVKPLKGIQTCKYNPIIRLTPKPDPILTPYPLSPLRKTTEEMLMRIADNEIKTIITQSQKHTGQNSVVNLKDHNISNLRGSNISSVRAADEKVEDAYDDSAGMDYLFFIFRILI